MTRPRAEPGRGALGAGGLSPRGRGRRRCVPCTAGWRRLPSEARGGRVFAYQAFRRCAGLTGLRRALASTAVMTSSPDPRRAGSHSWTMRRGSGSGSDVDGHRRLPRQASQQYLLTGLLRCPVCGARMGGKARKDRSRSYRCSAANLGANAPVPGCAITRARRSGRAGRAGRGASTYRGGRLSPSRTAAGAGTGVGGTAQAGDAAG